MKIAYLTSVHPRYDTRVDKMCHSFSIKDKVFLICADGHGNFKKKNINVYDVGKPKDRLYRILKSTNKIYKIAAYINADIYHIHDPELIGVGLKLLKKRKKVLFDSHEDVVAQLYDKKYINFFFRCIIIIFYYFYQKINLKKFTGIICATEKIYKRINKINTNSLVIKNYPTFKKKKSLKDRNPKKFFICYIGVISISRGIKILIKSLELVKNNVKLKLAGDINPPNLLNELKIMPGWKKVDYMGFVNNLDFYRLNKYKIGILNLLKTRNHNKSLPNKLFEYMKFKMPVILSKFSLWEHLNEKYKFGLICDQNDPKDLAKKIDYLLENPVKSKKMGINGYKAFKKYFNWENEKKKLISFYHKNI